MKIAIVPALVLSALLGACSGGGGGSGGATSGAAAESPQYAGLDAQILAWRTDIETQSPVCAASAGGKGCVGFEVACKGARTITPEEAAKGIGAKLVVAMVFASKDPSAKPGSAFAEFTKRGDTWTRKEAPSVNLSTCG